MAERLVKIIVDTSIYIPYINDGIIYPVLSDKGMYHLHYLSAVVVEELYAGAHDKKTIRLIDKLFLTAKEVGRLVVPEAADWQKAGKVIARMGKKDGFEEIYLARLTNDMLIALTAGRIGAVMYTANLKDFKRIQEYVDIKIAGPA